MRPARKNEIAISVVKRVFCSVWSHASVDFSVAAAQASVRSVRKKTRSRVFRLRGTGFRAIRPKNKKTKSLDIYRASFLSPRQRLPCDRSEKNEMQSFWGGLRNGGAVPLRNAAVGFSRSRLAFQTDFSVAAAWRSVRSVRKNKIAIFSVRRRSRFASGLRRGRVVPPRFAAVGFSRSRLARQAGFSVAAA